MKCFITGITGFVGSFLTENLVSKGSYDISGTYLLDKSLENLSGIADKVRLCKVDLQNYEDLKKIITDEKPDYIFHLAALTAPGESFKNPSEFLINNISVQVNILEAIRAAGISPRTLIVSSAEVYGDVVPSDLPIDEQTPLRPVNPYAVSKLTQDFLGLQYFLTYKLPIVRVRPFNHIGPKQSPSFVVASFAKKIAEIEKGLPAGKQGSIEPVLKVGNLTAKRDFTDVRDTVEGYVKILEQGEAGEVYNIGSGRSIQIQEIVDKLLSLSTKKIKVEQDQSLFRPVDVLDLVCDSSKLKQAVGWEPKIPIEQTLRETLEYWRSQV